MDKKKKSLQRLEEQLTKLEVQATDKVCNVPTLRQRETCLSKTC